MKLDLPGNTNFKYYLQNFNYPSQSAKLFKMLSHLLSDKNPVQYRQYRVEL